VFASTTPRETCGDAAAVAADELKLHQQRAGGEQPEAVAPAFKNADGGMVRGSDVLARVACDCCAEGSRISIITDADEVSGKCDQ
jgi:hypothetical protein